MCACIAGGRGEGPFIKGLDTVVKPVVLSENDDTSYVFALDWGTLSDAEQDSRDTVQCELYGEVISKTRTLQNEKYTTDVLFENFLTHTWMMSFA